MAIEFGVDGKITVVPLQNNSLVLLVIDVQYLLLQHPTIIIKSKNRMGVGFGYNAVHGKGYGRLDIFLGRFQDVGRLPKCIQIIIGSIILEATKDFLNQERSVQLKICL